MERFIKNDLMDYDTDYNELWRKVLKDDLSLFFKTLDPESPSPKCSDPSIIRYDYSLYDGIGSKLFVLLRLYSLMEKNLLDNDIISQLNLSRKKVLALSEQIHSLCLKIIQTKRSKRKEREIAFYTGESGIYALGIQVGVLSNNSTLVNQSFYSLLDLFSYLKKYSEKVEYELLYGVPGFLYSVLYANRLLKLWDWDSMKRDKINEMVSTCIDLIIKHGDSKFKVKKKHKMKGYNLVFDFYGSEYTGGAHGLSGNLMILLLAFREIPNLLCSEQMDNIAKILNSAEFILSLQNIPSLEKEKKQISYIIDWEPKANKEFKFEEKSVLESKNIYTKFKPHFGGWPVVNNRPHGVRDVQFCHGSPGVIPMLIEFHNFLRDIAINLDELEIDEKFIQDLYNKNKRAITLGLVNIWNQGLLKKGYGLCHGISGNAFSFLLASKDDKIFESIEERELLVTMTKAFMSVKRVGNVYSKIKGFSHSQRYRKGTSDFPYGLMNGLAGDLCLHFDLLGLNKGFPGFNL